MDEFSLVTAAKQGDVESFNELILAYQDMAYSVAYRILQDAHGAADATQTAFISAFRKLDQFLGENFKAWLMRIVTNACYDELRRRKRYPSTSLDGMIEDFEMDTLPISNDDDHDLHLMAKFEEPESAIQRQELQVAIEDCMEQLNDAYRIVAVLVDVEGLSYEEVSAMTDISLGTVKSRLSRARARLRDCLRGKEELLPSQFRLNNS
ncbi:MAG: sigma-70 family RNA polymerase sigma factor [Anaerolineales bacterium]|nr:sigma-70 family RNA polymerase sigma factor [Anaerolineales bacterium]